MSFLVRGCVVFLAVMSSITARGAEFFFRDGDVIVMVGDSITEQHLYSNYVEIVKTLEMKAHTVELVQMK